MCWGPWLKQRLVCHQGTLQQRASCGFGGRGINGWRNTAGCFRAGRSEPGRSAQTWVGPGTEDSVSVHRATERASFELLPRRNAQERSVHTGGPSGEQTSGMSIKARVGPATDWIYKRITRTSYTESCFRQTPAPPPTLLRSRSYMTWRLGDFFLPGPCSKPGTANHAGRHVCQ